MWSRSGAPRSGEPGTHFPEACVHGFRAASLRSAPGMTIFRLCPSSTISEYRSDIGPRVLGAYQGRPSPNIRSPNPFLDRTAPDNLVIPAKAGIYGRNGSRLPPGRREGMPTNFGDSALSVTYKTEHTVGFGRGSSLSVSQDRTHFSTSWCGMPSPPDAASSRPRTQEAAALSLTASRVRAAPPRSSARGPRAASRPA